MDLIITDEAGYEQYSQDMVGFSLEVFVLHSLYDSYPNSLLLHYTHVQ
jgi:hypothetical protein